MPLMDTLKLGKIKTVKSEYSLPQKHQFLIILQKSNKFLLQSKFIEQSLYLQKDYADNGSHIIFINQNFNVKIFRKVMMCLSGQCSQFQKKQQIQQLMHILNFLMIHNLKNQVINDLIANFDDYDFFVVFKMSQKFNIPDLKRKCLSQLLNLQFQQLNFNKFTLLQCHKQIFLYIIKVHQYYRNSKIIKGLKSIQLKKIIEDYCHYNDTQLNLSIALKISQKTLQKIRVSQETIQESLNFQWKNFTASSFNLSQFCNSIDFGQVPSGENQQLVQSNPFAYGQSQSSDIFCSQDYSQMKISSVPQNNIVSSRLLIPKLSFGNEQIQDSNSICQTQLSDLNADQKIEEFQFEQYCPQTPETPDTPITPQIIPKFQIQGAFTFKTTMNKFYIQE